MKKRFSILLAVFSAVLVLFALCSCSRGEYAPAEPAAVETTLPSNTLKVTPGPTETAESTTDSDSASNEAAADAETAPAEGTPPAGYYVGDDGYLLLLENGTAIQNVTGSSWFTHWDEEAIYSEFGAPGIYTYQDGHFSFGWEGGDGYYTFDYVYCPNELPPLEAAETSVVSGGSGFFDSIEGDPFFVHSKDGKHYGYEDDFWGGCSVWCAVNEYRLSASASSFLEPQGQYTYEPGNILDNNRNNAWIEGAEGCGIGEYVELGRCYVVGDEDYGVDFREICIVNGYARTADTWKNNSRVHELKMYFNGEYICTLPLLDAMEPQYFNLCAYQLHADSGAESVFRFEIASVYPGDKYEDTAITGIEMSFWTPNH